MDSPLITLAVVSHNQRHLVNTLLCSLSDIDTGVDFQVILLENITGQPQIDLGEFDFPIQVVENAIPMGLSSNINKAFELGGRTTEFFCILNPDIRFTQEIFSPLIEALRTKQIDVISPLIVDRSGEIQDSFRPLPSPAELILRFIGAKIQRYQFDELEEYSFPDWIGAMFMLMPSAVFDDLNGFNTSYRLYFEDVDFSVRARQKGYRLAVKKSVQVIHEAQRDSHKNFNLFWTHLKSAMRFFTSGVYWREIRTRNQV